MIKNYLSYILYFAFLTNSLGQIVVDEYTIQSQSFIKFNSVVLNPSFSVFADKKAQVLAYYRNQGVSLNTTQKNYLLNYNASKLNKNGYGLSIFQKTIGVWQNFGAIANYGKGIQLSENAVLAFGLNLIYNNTNLNSKSYVLGDANDPILTNFEVTQMTLISPGISFQTNRFLIGAMVENGIDYNFKTQKQQSVFADKSYMGTVKYTTAKNETNSLFENADLSLITHTKFRQNTDLEVTAGAIYNAPRMGWLQGSYNTLYGVSIGAGVAVSPKIAIGYNFEKNIINKLTDIGASHELYLTYSFGDNQIEAEKPKKKDYSSLSLEKEEIQRYKKKVYNKDIVEQEQKTKEKLEAFIKIAEEENISYLLLPEKNTGIKKGYYLVTKVLISSTIAENKTAEQKKNGLRKSSFFTTFSGDWNYVYLERYDTIEEAKKDYMSNYNNKYKDPLWILPIL